MINFDRVPIIKGLEFYKNQNNTAFHMPGHKQNKKVFEELEFLKDNIYSYDVTEISGTDNLYEAEEMIKDAQILLAEAMGSWKSYMLVNGSTCGIYTMILGLLNQNDKVIVQRNCHKSVHTAIYLGKLSSVYVYPKVIKDFDIASTVDACDLAYIISENKDAKAVIITSPTYYGTCADIKEISKLCKDNNMLLLVDEAHGAHFNFSSLLPETAISLGADISVSSFHKTLPAFTQTAVLNLSNNFTKAQMEKIEYGLQMFQSSSPSYLFLASIDIARYLMQTKGEKLLKELKINIDKTKQVLSDIKEIKILDETYLENESYDFTRLVINTPVKGNILLEVLRNKYNIQVEMADFNNVVLIATVADTEEMYEKLVKALKEIFENIRYGNENIVKNNENANIDSCKNIDNDTSFSKGKKFDKTIIIDINSTNNFISKSEKNKISNSNRFMPKPKIVMNRHEAEELEKELVDIQDAVGRISAESLVPYPPGIPLVLAGEEITSEIISYIYDLKSYNLNLTKSLSSSEENKIYVILK